MLTCVTTQYLLFNIASPQPTCLLRYVIQDVMEMRRCYTIVLLNYVVSLVHDTVQHIHVILVSLAVSGYSVTTI